jgi:hypothetical protein
MSFANPPYPWAVFFSVLMGVGLGNYVIATILSSKTTWKDAEERAEKVWKDSTEWLELVIEKLRP